MLFENVELYDEYADAQKQISQQLIQYTCEKLNLQKFNYIIDIGCGTGFCSQNIIDNIQQFLQQELKIILIDKSFSMLELAKKKLTNSDNINKQNNQNKIIFEFIHGDASNILDQYHFKNSLILANMSLQWINDIKLFVQQAINLQNTICFSLPTTNSFKNWQEAHQLLNIPCYLHNLISIDYINSINLKHLKVQPLKLNYDNCLEFMRHFKYIDAYKYKNYYTVKQLRTLINAFKQNKQIEFTTFYEIAYVICQ